MEQTSALDLLISYTTRNRSKVWISRYFNLKYLTHFYCLLTEFTIP